MIYSLLNKKIIYPLYFRWNMDNRLQYLKYFEKKQWDSHDQIMDRQFLKFKKLLKYAYENCPFYGSLYSRVGLLPNDIQRIEDIEKVPIITKKDLQENIDSMLSISHDPRDRYKDFSGGSTGMPTGFWIDKCTLAKKFGSGLMFDRWSGWDIGDEVFYLWGADREKNKAKEFKESIVQKYIYRNHNLNAFEFTENGMELFARTLVKKKPKLIVAYANLATAFAKYIEDKSSFDVSASAIITSAETLTCENRNIIERVFGCKVYNRYGSREVGLIAGECSSHAGMHVNSENILLQINKLSLGGNSNDLGEIIVSDLNNFAMPFIRYNMGDVSSEKDRNCTCGRGLPLIGEVTGRTSDFIKTKRGKFVHGEYFSHLFYGLDSITSFQIIQKSFDEINIFIVSSSEVSAETKENICLKIRQELEENVVVNISQVKSFQNSSSGKFRFVISNV